MWRVLFVVIFTLLPLNKANAESLFDAFDESSSVGSSICYATLVGFGSDGANVMLGTRNSVFSCLKAKQPSLISFHYNRNTAALIANHICLTTWRT